MGAINGKHGSVKNPTYPMPALEFDPLEGAEGGISCEKTDMHKDIGFKPLWILPAMGMGIVAFQGIRFLLKLL